MAESVIRTVIARYRTILTNEEKWIQPVFRRTEYDLVWNRDDSLKKNGQFSVNTLEGRIKVPFCLKGMEQYFDGSCEFGTAKLVNRHGRFFLHISVTRKIELPENSSIHTVVGIDRGLRFLAAACDSNGKSTFCSGAKVKDRRAYYKALRQRLQKRQTPSSRRRLKAVGGRENRWMSDVNHCVSKALAQAYPKNTLFVLEDLTGIRKESERVCLKYRYLNVSWAYFDLEQKLIYKANLAGSKVIKADPAYTSQRCPRCGHTSRSNRDKVKHIFKCRNCGYTSNDDRIGAMNLCCMGMEYLAESRLSISPA
jgi:IS605 OrfB family transposase